MWRALVHPRRARRHNQWTCATASRYAPPDVVGSAGAVVLVVCVVVAAAEHLGLIVRADAASNFCNAWVT
jgi:hypothetical protein